MIYLSLFWCFLKIGLFSVGGGYAAMPLIQSEVVEKNGWLTAAQYSDLITIAEMTPGPIAVNTASFVGVNLAGVPGALAATAGCIFPSLVIVSILFYIYNRYKKVSLMQGVLGGLRPAVTALIAAAGVSLLISLVFPQGFILSAVNWAGLVIFAAAFFVLRKFKANPIIVMCACGAAGLLFG